MYLLSAFAAFVVMFPIADTSTYVHVGLVIDLRAEIAIVYRMSAVA